MRPVPDPEDAAVKRDQPALRHQPLELGMRHPERGELRAGDHTLLRVRDPRNCRTSPPRVTNWSPSALFVTLGVHFRSVARSGARESYKRYFRRKALMRSA